MAQSYRTIVGLTAQQTYAFDPNDPPAASGAITVNGAPATYTLNYAAGTFTLASPTIAGGESILIVGAAALVAQAEASNIIPPAFRNLIRNPRLSLNQRGYNLATFVGSTSGTVLTVSSVITGILQVGAIVSLPGIPAGTYIASLGTGTGNTGTYNLSQSSTIGSNAGSVTGYVLAANQYGHDGVKGGAAGATYTWGLAANGIDTILTVLTGTVILPIESLFISGGFYTLSGLGTASARVWQGTGTAGSGNYVAGPQTVNLTAGLQTNVEFGVGTIWLPQLEPGLFATQFERRPDHIEYFINERYLVRWLGNAGSEKVGLLSSVWTTTTNVLAVIALRVRMAAAPTASYLGLNAAIGGAGAAVTAVAVDVASQVTPSFNFTSSGGTANAPGFLLAGTAGVNAYFILSAELA